jgi:uncharacterized protein with FMN-binding domain
MGRIAAWFLSTVTVVVLLFGYRTSLSGPMATTGEMVAAAPVGDAVSGPVAQTRWGPVQVQVVLDGSKITAVTVPQYPQGNRKDQEINARALPILVQETLDAQSATIDMVSGATVTSEGYLESLQGALDQAGR